MEHAARPPNFESLEEDEAGAFEFEQELQAVHDEAKRIKTELAALEKRMTRRRKEIAGWQKRYDAMTADKKETVRTEFEDAVNWRTREIDLIQVRIKALESQAAIARGSAQGVAFHSEYAAEASWRGTAITGLYSATGTWKRPNMRLSASWKRLN